MRKKLLLTTAVLAFSTLFITTGIFAGTTASDMIKMENKAYKKHKKSILVFYG